MEHTEHTDNPVHTRIMLLMLAFVLLLASIVGYYLLFRKTPTRKGSDKATVTPVPTMSPTLIPYPMKGSFVLKVPSDLAKIQLGSTFILELLATSADTVAGYDAILSYDSTAFENEMVQNGIDMSFDIFTYNRPTHIAVSATKKLQASQPIRFNNTSILAFTFTARKKGVYIFSLKPVGNESAKLVDESAQVTYPATSDFRLEIK